MNSKDLNKTIELHREISQCRKVALTEPEIDLENYLLNTFHVGDFFFFVYYLPEQKIEFCSEGVRTVLGISPEEWNLAYIIENMHADDMNRFVQNEASVLPLLQGIAPDKLKDYKVRYDFRLLTKHGEYKRILHQAITLQNDDDGAIIRTFCVYTDITPLKSEGHVNVSLIGLNDEPSYFDIQPGGVYSSIDQALSKRELEVVRLIASGLTSKQIGESLNISHHTVNNHRKNICKKMNTDSTQELILLGLDQGWL